MQRSAAVPGDAMTCPACGHATGPAQKFCDQCGARLSAAGGPPPAMPGHLARKILDSRIGRDGERKQVTVLFADLAGSLELLADRDPEDAREVLDPVLDLMTDAVHALEGTVNQVMGDGIMALFGAPIAHEDHAVRACHAALRMQEAVKRYAARIHAHAGVAIGIRVGLNSGDVVVRAIGSDLNVDYSAIGPTTHLAARMEQTATPGTIRVTAETLRLAEGFVESRPLGRVAVKGLAVPIEVHELIGARPALSRLHAAAARGLTRFVGREDETRRLREALEAARAGRGQIVAVTGQPGVGKSRLCWEFVHSPDAAAWRVLQSGGVSYGTATPLLPIVRLLEAYFELERGRGAVALRREVTARVLALDPALEWAVPALLALLDLPVERASTWEAVDPLHRRRRTLEAVCALLVRESQVTPLVVVLEDLQWIDGESQAVLDQLVEELPAHRILLLVTFRPEYRPPWAAPAVTHELVIDTLPRQRTEELLDVLLGGDASLRPLRALLIERTEGNPFYLEESVRSLAESGSLGGRPGAHRLVKPVDARAIAPSVRAVLAARIDRLGTASKRLLQAAAVIGTDVPLPWLEAMADDPEPVAACVAELLAADFMDAVSAGELTFKHALTHEVAYGEILNERKRRLHGRVVDVVEELEGGRLGEHADTLAHHALIAQRWEKAIDYLRVSGARAYASGAVGECLDRYEQGLRLLPHLGPGLADRRRAIDLHLDIYGPLFFLGQFERLAELSGQALAWAERIGDRHRLGRASVRLAAAGGARAEYAAAITHAGRALDVAEDVGDVELRIAASHLLGVCHEAQGDYTTAMRFLADVVDGAHAELAKQRLGLVLPPYIFDSGWMAACLAYRGRFDEARAYSARAVQAADDNDHPGAQTFAYALYATVLGQQGRFAEACLAAERAVELGEAHRVFAFLSVAYSTRGWVYAWLGRRERAREDLELGVSAHESVGLRMHAGTFHGRLAEGLVLAGDAARAAKAAARAREVSEASGERGSEAEALRVLGDAARDGGAPGAAAEAYARARELATALGMRPLLAHVHAGLAVLARRAGRHDLAGDGATATAMYRELAMPFWLERLEAALTSTP
jgi:class 3 adenylate cyclase/tetratricopeptide (TPR) repeat protein